MRLQTAGPNVNLGLTQPEARGRNSGRRGWGSTVLMVAGSLAIAIVSYSLSIRVSGERAEVDRIMRQNVALAEDLKALDAELRVRMRLPELQRWNDDVLGLMPISAHQYLDDPLRLAAYGEEVPVAPPRHAPALQQAIAPARPATATPHRVAHQPAPQAGQPNFTPSAPTYSARDRAPMAAVRTVALKTDAAPTRPAPEKPAARPEPRAPAATSGGLDPLLIAAVNEAARREAARPGSAPADLLLQIDMADTRRNPTH